MLARKTISYIDIPLSTPWFTVKSTTLTSTEEPGSSVPLYFHVQILWKVSKSICRFHWRTTMKRTIKALMRWEEVSEGCRPQAIFIHHLFQYLIQLFLKNNKCALQDMVSSETQSPVDSILLSCNHAHTDMSLYCMFLSAKGQLSSCANFLYVSV